jgi:short-subunit dehydrogenase
MEYRNALITGASSGIGKSLALQLAREGAEVVLAARRVERLESVADSIRGEGGRARVLVLDVGDCDAAVAGIRRTDAEIGGLDLVVACAGIGLAINATRLTWERVRELCRVNFDGAIATLTAVLPQMVARQRGHLVGVSSAAGLAPFPMGGAYGASKAGLSMFLASLRLDLAGSGVGVSSIHPGFVHTEMTASVTKKVPFALEADAAASLILRRLAGNPANIDVPAAAIAPVRIIASLPALVRDSLIARFPLPDESP